MKEVRNDPCSHEGCERGPLYDLRRGFCKYHYHRLWATGELPPMPDLAELLIRWRKTTGTGCWEWRGAISTAGYGCYAGRYVHRFSYELVKGAIPEGLTIDHLCRNPPCFNPGHLEAVTQAVNNSRASGSHILRTGRCAAGHLMDQQNTRRYVTRKGYTRLICRACHRIRARELRWTP